MSAISIGGSLAAGFRLVARRSATVAVWAVFHLAVSALTTAVLVSLAGPALQTMIRSGGNGGAALAALATALPAYLLALAIAAITWSIIGAAVNRAVLRPEQASWGYLRLGGDELRQLALGLIWTLIGFVAYIVAFIVAVIGTAVASLAGGAVNAPVVAVVLLAAVMGPFMIFFAPRFSLASAQTFDSGRLHPFASGGLTRERYWPLLAIWAATLLIGAAVYGATLGLNGAVNMAFSPRHEFSLTRNADMSTLQSFFGPETMIKLVGGAVLNALLWPLILAPFAAAYRAVAPGGERAAEVFT